MPGLEALACNLDTDHNYVTLAMLQLRPFLNHQVKLLQLLGGHAHSKQVFTGHLYDICTKAPSIVVIKIMTSAPGIEIRIAFLICYLQLLYENEPGHYFCPEFMGHVTNQNILVDAGKLM